MNHPAVDAFLAKAKTWGPEMRALRALVSRPPLVEDVKWGKPCYALDGKNVVLVHAFKDYCALLFFKGALMSDPRRLLIQQTGNVQAGRQIRFTRLDEIVEREADIKAYLAEAIEIETSGRRVEMAPPAQTPSPAEFDARLEASPALKAAFAKLTPGRRRAYLLYFNGAKQSKTRAARVEKCEPDILAGKGLDD